LISGSSWWKRCQRSNRKTWTKGQASPVLIQLTQIVNDIWECFLVTGSFVSVLGNIRKWWTIWWPRRESKWWL